MAKQKKLYMGTNTKMTKTTTQTVEFLQGLYDATKDISREQFELFVIPSFTTLARACASIPANTIRIGAQNIGWAESGQFTGEISPLMLKELGVEIAMIGHSERRHVLMESDEMENKRVLCTLRNSLIPLLCIGETKEEKEQGRSDDVLRQQLRIGLQGVNPEQARCLRVAYEPVWAIGEGGTPASKEYASEKHGVIRSVLAELLGNAVAEEIPLLYGGSVNPGNAEELIAMDDIDGLFIGRSAWQADAFNRIIRSVIPVWERK